VSTWFATVAHPARAHGWDIRWGHQLDARTIHLPAPASGQSANIAVAAYLAKYATKSTEAVGTLSCRITAANVAFYGNPRSHQGRLIRARLAPRQPHQPRLPSAPPLGPHAWLPRPLRHQEPTLLDNPPGAPPCPRRLPPPPAPTTRNGHDGHSAVITVITLEWAGMGWRTSGDALLALSAAARTREHERIARDETLSI
jgi:hypothetical protein